jgi:transcription elongation factor Elf1
MVAGGRYRATHQATVDSILGARVRPVYSRGTAFYNHDVWRGRLFLIYLCAWASRNPGKKPTLPNIRHLCDQANDEVENHPHIVIAATPEELPLRMALALMGGAAHEAFHTKYSRRRNLIPKVMKSLVDSVWGRVKDWSKLGPTLLDWDNIIDDIRIEHAGIEDYPGTEPKLHDTLTYMLDREEESRKEALKEGVPESAFWATQSVVELTFREIGRGYNTERARRAFDLYKEKNPQAVAFVLEGPLAPLLRETKALGGDDDLSSLRLALEVVATLVETAEHKPKKEQPKPKPKKGKGGKPQAATCPNCGSSNVGVKPNKDDKSKGLLICGRCGYQEEVELQEGGSGGAVAQELDEDGKPKQGKEGKEGQGEGQGQGKEGQGKGKEGQGKPQEGDGGTGGGQGSGDDPKGSGGQSGPAQGGKGTEAPGTPGGSKNDGYADGAGGPGFHDEDPAEGWEVIAAGFLEDAEKGRDPGLLDPNAALGEGFGDLRGAEDRSCRGGEQPYRPYDPSLDVVDFVKPSKRGLADDKRRAGELLSSVRSQCIYLRSRLRVIVRSVEQAGTEHGLRKGVGLSPRMFVDDVACLRAGRMPDRAYYEEDEEIDTSAAVVVVIDESSSMNSGRGQGANSRLQLASKGMFAIVEAFDFLNFPSMAIGFRNGRNPSTFPDDSADFFRLSGAHIDVFKAFHEPFRGVSWRFANTRATGTTPMADGIQYAMEALLPRTERHRLIFVMTDGQPDPNHRPVINRQLRLSTGVGIHTVGVGIGSGTQWVSGLFPDHVYAPNIQDLARLLILKLNLLLDFRGLQQGRPSRSGLPTAHFR